MAPATEVLLPEGDGPHPAVVLGAEAYGVNNFIRGIQEKRPALFLYGDQDKLMSPSVLADMRHRIDDWRVDARIKMYPGAGHSFTCPHGPLRNAEADRTAWNDAITFLSEHMGA
jgi:dienelactone hydrolase